MIKGIGCDIVEIARLKDRLKKKILSPAELTVYESFESETRRREYLAGRFAIKEAIVKAAGIIPFPELVILDDENGIPRLFSHALEGLSVWVSISHEKAYAIGMCVVEDNPL